VKHLLYDEISCRRLVTLACPIQKKESRADLFDFAYINFPPFGYQKSQRHNPMTANFSHTVARVLIILRPGSFMLAPSSPRRPRELRQQVPQCPRASVRQRTGQGRQPHSQGPSLCSRFPSSVAALFARSRRSRFVMLPVVVGEIETAGRAMVPDVRGIIVEQGVREVCDDNELARLM